MTQKPMLREEVYARALRASQNRKENGCLYYAEVKRERCFALFRPVSALRRDMALGENNNLRCLIQP
jgi:hypothetical protein